MKQVSAEVLNLDVQKLIEMLNAALCEEWLAYYQYWVGARVTEGPMRSEIESEMLKHADEELSHAVKLIDRIIQLGGTPVLSPDQWMKMARCKYEAPTDPYIETVSNRICAANAVQSSATRTSPTLRAGSTIQPPKWPLKSSKTNWNTSKTSSRSSATSLR